MIGRSAGALVVVATLLLASLVLAACQQESQGPSDEVLIQDPNYIIGAGLYKRHCTGCHGETGEGRDLAWPSDQHRRVAGGYNDDEIRAVILEGRRVAGTSMDSFREILSDDEITAVITYIRTLQP